MSSTAVPWTGLSTRWLSSAELGGEYGASLLVTIPPGGGYPPHRHQAVERLVYVIEGSGTHRGDGGAVGLVADDRLLLPPSSWHGFENAGDQPATLVMLYTPVTSFPADDYEVADDSTAFGAELNRLKVHEAPVKPDVYTPERGFDGFDVSYHAADGSEAIVFGYARFWHGTQHRWHAHTSANEAAYVLSGEGYHHTDERGAELVRAGETFWIPTGQWHTFTIEEGQEVDLVWWYLGARTIDDSGYVLRETIDEAFAV